MFSNFSLIWSWVLAFSCCSHRLINMFTFRLHPNSSINIDKFNVHLVVPDVYNVSTQSHLNEIGSLNRVNISYNPCNTLKVSIGGLYPIYTQFAMAVHPRAAFGTSFVTGPSLCIF